MTGTKLGVGDVLESQDRNTTEKRVPAVETSEGEDRAVTDGLSNTMVVEIWRRAASM